MYLARRSLIKLLLNGILLTAVLTACGGQPAATQAPVDINATVAAAAETLAAALFLTQTAIAPTATYTPQPTPTPLATSTALALPTTVTFPTATQAVLVYFSPTPTGTFYTQTPLASSLAVGCNNLRIINTYTDPAGPFTPGQEFTQSWQVENNGTCDWVYLYHLVHASGDRMGGSPPRLSKVIPPGKWTTLSVNLEAPSKDGTYNAAWRFSDQGGTPFGASLPVSITVKKNPDPTKTPDVLQTAVAGTVAVQLTQTVAAQQTAVSIGQTAVAGTAISAAQTATAAAATAVAQTATSAAATATCGTLTAQGTPCP
jgi:hypothetical protein